jgi:hypothetical protein
MGSQHTTELTLQHWPGNASQSRTLKGVDVCLPEYGGHFRHLMFSNFFLTIQNHKKARLSC